MLLIDEINRGNIAKVFGELYYLLEYRGDDDQIDLQYGSEPFELPENFLIVATMNTADRSIAILDAALRRRFHFVDFFPDRWPVEGLLRRWLQRHAPTMIYVADLVDAANRMLPDRHLQIGPSYFMRPGLNRQWLERIWAHSVLPYVEEQFFDEPDRVEEFTLAAIEQRINGAPGSQRPSRARRSTIPSPRLIRLQEWKPSELSLDAEELAELQAIPAKLTVQPAAGRYVVTPGSIIGAATTTRLHVVIEPKLSIDRVFFLLGYARQLPLRTARRRRSQRAKASSSRSSPRSWTCCSERYDADC